MGDFAESGRKEMKKNVEVDAEVVRLKKELEQLLQAPSFTQRELERVASQVWKLLESHEVYARLHNTEALKNLTLPKEEREQRKIKNGASIPGGGLSCIAGFGFFRALKEKELLQNIDEIIASSGGSWVAAYGLAALHNAEMIRVAVSVFARDLRNHLFLNTKKFELIKRLLKKIPLADLQRVRNLVSGAIPGMRYKPEKGEEDFKSKELDIDSLQEALKTIGFHISVTDPKTGKAEYINPNNLTKEELMNALYASSTMPRVIGKVDPKTNKNKRYDGDLSADAINKFIELGVNSAIVSLHRPMKRTMSGRMPKIIEKLIFSDQEHSEVLKRKYQQLDLTYLLNVLQMIEYGKNNALYVFEPDRKDEIDMKDINDRSHKKLYNLYFSMYKKIKKKLNDL